jgi:hypothetical protein
MNLKFSPETTPSGSRFLYRNSRGELGEATIREWSNSGDYLNWDGKWMSLNDTQYLTLVEILSVDNLYVARKDSWNKL